MKLCIYAWFGFPLPMRERAAMIRAAGFDAVMLWWGDEYTPKNSGERKETLPDLFRQAGLEIENMHMPFAGVNDLWLEGAPGEEVEARFAACLEDCRTYGIPKAVMHPTAGYEPPPLGKVGLDRVRRLVERAEACGVDLAVENMRRPDYLDRIFASIRSDRLKFCYDSGHENCFTPGVDVLERYGDKLVTMHLHDNGGKLDQHMLPFGGTIDWGRVAGHLSRLGYGEPLCFESDASHEKNANYTAEAYLDEVVKRARRLEGMMDSSGGAASAQR